jgi:hypothetical protein
VCPRCAEGEEGAFDVGDYREHFARGYREGERDLISGMPRSLVAAEGDDPPVVKSEDHSYYHGYKAAVEGKALDESSAWSAYVAKHSMRANARRRVFRVGQDVEMISSPANVGHVVGYDPDGSVMVQWSGGTVVTGVSPDNLRGLPPGYAGVQVRRAVPNPLHLSLDGNFSFGIGTKDDEHMKANSYGGAYIVEIYSEGASRPEDVRGRFRTSDEAEAYAETIRKVARDRGWNKVVRVNYRPLPGQTPNANGGWCRICGERIPEGEVLCEHHERERMDERWADAPSWEEARGMVHRGEHSLVENGWHEELIDSGESLKSHMPGLMTLSRATLSLGVPRRRRRVYAIRMGVDEQGIAKGGFHWFPANEPEKAEEWWLDRTGRHVSLQDAGYSPNARKNVSAVIDAFAEGRRHSEKTVSTDGSRIYSYNLLIAARMGADGEPTRGTGQVLVLDTRESPSVTTSGQINAVRAAFRDAEIVTSFPVRATHAPNAWHFGLGSKFDLRSGDHVVYRDENRVVHAVGTLGGRPVVWFGEPPNAEYAPVEEVSIGTSMKRNAALTEGTCDLCGEPFEIITATGVANHVTPDGDVDYDADADHVPYEGAMAANMRGGGRVIESKHWRHRTGRTASPYGSVPWTGAPGDRESDWQMESAGWTIQWDDGTVGIGRVPFETPEQAEAWLAKERARLQEAEEWRRRSFPEQAQPAPRRRRSRSHSPNGRQYATEWYQPLDLATVTSILGADHVAEVLGRDNAAGYAESRAAGWWDANDPDHHNAYASLARMIRAGDLDDMIAEARGRR